MISINGKTIVIEHFPDGTQRLKLADELLTTYTFGFSLAGNIETKLFRYVWKYESDEELVTLMFVVNHLKEQFPEAKNTLFMPYVPNARMDRIKNSSEVFTLKYFCQVINSLGFEKVTVLDPHSNVTPALLDRVCVIDPKPYIDAILEKHNFKYVYFPDEGAMKRYCDLFPNQNLLVGHKRRDWSTGKIMGLEISSPDGITFENGHFGGCSVLMIDDIISYGGTLAYSADELRKLGFKDICAYASHVENSVLNKENGTLLKRIEGGVVTTIFTTDSIFTEFPGHPEFKVVAVDEFLLNDWDEIVKFL